MKDLLRRRWAAILIVALALGCVPGPAASPSPTATSSPPPTQTPAATITPAAPATSPPQPTVAPTATPPAVAAASCPPPVEGLVPPTASLEAPEATAVAGVLGSFDYCETSADALPPAAASLSPLRLESRMSELTVELPDGTPFVGWRGTYTDVADGRQVPTGDADFATSVASATFRGPTMGAWLLSLTLDFGTDVGSATYYWRIVVP